MIYGNYVGGDYDSPNAPWNERYVTCPLCNGKGFHFWAFCLRTREEITEHAKRYSQTFKSEYTRKSSKWTTDFDAMATKTVLKLLLSKYAPLSVEMQELREAITADQASFGDNGEIDYIDGVSAEEINAEAVQEVVHEQKDEMKEKDTKAVVEGMLM